MQIQLIRNATLRMTYGDHVFITDPYFAPKYSQEPLIGKSRNPVVDLPFSVEDLLVGVEMALVSHLHPDHFDHLAQQRLPKDIQIYRNTYLKWIESAKRPETRLALIKETIELLKAGKKQK